ncbi:MAG: hypothetical protein ACKN9U_09205, partial [Pirellulaceae bacterium]
MEACRQRYESLISWAACLLTMPITLFSWAMPDLLGQDAASQAIDAAIQAGDLHQAISNVRKLQLEQRLDWIDPLWNQWQTSSNSSSQSDSSASNGEGDAGRHPAMG